MPDEREFYNSRPQFETRPEDDPPMTVRCDGWELRAHPSARRAIKTGYSGYGPSGKWFVVTGQLDIDDDSMGTQMLLNDEDVADWPVVHPLTYTTAFRHTQTREALERGAAGQLEGDMGVEAFRGGSFGPVINPDVEP